MTVYSKPTCVQCTATYRALDKVGLPYRVVDLSQDDAALLEVRALGHQQVPVVVDGDQNWSGFRPDLIRAAAERARAA
ncbi:glutaredoxin-like protein NrdH [Tessaracoccus sp. SD287]|nr:glutaredoxin-like protein NrdH [Tessaracoccus sp. SD287]